MSEYVSFENNNEVKGYNRFVDNKKLPFFCNLIIRMGFAKEEKQANKVLAYISGVLIVLAIIFFIISIQPVSVKVLKIQARPPISEVQVQTSQTVPTQSSR